MKKRAFTLGEVLITLTIVGVVAILVVPSFINNIGDKSRAASIKNTLSDLNNAVQTYMISHHIKNLSDVDLKEGEDAEFIIENLSVKRDKNDDIVRFKPPKYELLNQNQSYDNAKYGAYTSTNLYLNNGVGIAINPEKVSSDGASYYSILIDTNGEDIPNIIGIDAFEFMLLTTDYEGSDQTYYAGEFYAKLDNSSKTEDCKKGDANACSALLIDSGYNPSYYNEN